MRVPIRRTASVFVFILLLSVLIHIAYTRGISLQLGGPVAALHGPNPTEESWIVGEIVRDVTEMSAYPAKVLSEVSIAPSVAGVYRVSTNLTSGAVELDLRQDLWAPAKFAIVAQTVTKPPAGVHQTGMTSPVHPVLLDLTPATLVEASTSISRALEANMRDARAH